MSPSTAVFQDRRIDFKDIAAQDPSFSCCSRNDRPSTVESTGIALSRHRGRLIDANLRGMS